jgi:hypothetical protein
VAGAFSSRANSAARVKSGAKAAAGKLALGGIGTMAFIAGIPRGVSWKSRGSSPLATEPVFSVHKKHDSARKKCTQKKRAAGWSAIRRNHSPAYDAELGRRNRSVGRKQRAIALRGSPTADRKRAQEIIGAAKVPRAPAFPLGEVSRDRKSHMPDL